MTIAAPLFLIALDPNLSHSLQAQAQINNTDNIISSNITSDMANKVISEQSIILSGIISSEDFNNVALKTGEDPHGAAILPNRDDGTIHTDIVTFIATKPVGVSISHRLYIDNNTFSKIDADRFGALDSGYHNDTGERRNPRRRGYPLSYRARL